MAPSPSIVRRFLSDDRGGVTMVGALSLSAIVGMTGLAMEVGQGYAEKVGNQRIADAAALAAALAYSAGSDAGVVLPTARAIAVANGLASTAVTAPNPTTDAQGRKIVRVTVTTAIPLYLTRILTTATSYDVTSVGEAAVTTTTTSTETTPLSPSACLIALSATAIPSLLLDGNAKVTSDTSNTGCDVQAVKTLRLKGSSAIVARYVQANGDVLIDTDGSGTINAQEVDAGGSLTTYTWGSAITTTPTANKKYSGKSSAIGDPLANNAALAAALAKTSKAENFPTVAAPAAPATPTGVDWTLSSNSGSGGPIQTSWRSGSIWTIPAGTYAIARLSIGGGTTVRFAAGSTVTVSNGIAMGGDRLSILGSGNNWAVNGGIDSGWGGIDFGGGSYRIGGNVTVSNSTFGDGDFIVSGKLTIGQNSKDRNWPYPPMTMGAGKHQFGELVVDGGAGGSFGDGDFSVARSITIGGAGGLTVNLGSSARTIAIGRTDAATPSISVTGSGTATFNGTAIGTVFTTAGSITTGGDSAITFPAAGNHYIGGTLTIGGGATFGKGAYTIRGDFLKNASKAVTGSDISFFLSGRMEMAGASTGTLAAPTASTANAGEALINLLFASTYNVASAGAIKWDGSTNSTYSGVIYFPKMPVTVTGGGVVGGCLTLIADTITVSGSGEIRIRRCGNIAAAAGGATASPTTTTTTTVALIR